MASENYYKNRKDSELYGERLLIYQRTDLDSDNYFFRAKISGVKGYVRRSCKTNNAARAMVYAEDSYLDLQSRHKGGMSLTKLTVDKFYLDWLESNKNRFTKSRYQWKKSVWNRYMSGYFGSKQVSELTKSFCDGYWEYRLNFWKNADAEKRIELNDKRIGAKTKSSHNVAVNPAFATLRGEASLINEFLQAAMDRNHLSRMIKVSAQTAMAKSERGDSFRDTFTEHEWKVLTSNLYNYAHNRGKFKGERVHRLHRFQRMMLRAFVLFASSTGMRVGEIKQARWGDLRLDKDSDGNRVLVVGVRAETSKVRRGRSAVAFSDHIIAVMDEYKALSQYTGDDDLIFYSVKTDGSVGVVDMSANFKSFLRSCDYKDRKEGLRFSKDGKARTLYSLRHFYAVSRLKKGVDVYRLATSMGTGVTQIKNHYGSSISGEAFIDELTKNSTKTGEEAKSVAVRKLIDMVQSGVLDEEVALEQLKRVSATR